MASSSGSWANQGLNWTPSPPGDWRVKTEGVDEDMPQSAWSQNQEGWTDYSRDVAPVSSEDRGRSESRSGSDGSWENVQSNRYSWSYQGDQSSRRSHSSDTTWSNDSSRGTKKAKYDGQNALLKEPERAEGAVGVWYKSVDYKRLKAATTHTQEEHIMFEGRFGTWIVRGYDSLNQWYDPAGFDITSGFNTPGYIIWYVCCQELMREGEITKKSPVPLINFRDAAANKRDEGDKYLGYRVAHRAEDDAYGIRRTCLYRGYLGYGAKHDPTIDANNRCRPCSGLEDNDVFVAFEREGTGKN